MERKRERGGVGGGIYRWAGGWIIGWLRVEERAHPCIFVFKGKLYHSHCLQLHSAQSDSVHQLDVGYNARLPDLIVTCLLAEEAFIKRAHRGHTPVRPIGGFG